MARQAFDNIAKTKESKVCLLAAIEGSKVTAAHGRSRTNDCHRYGNKKENACEVVYVCARAHSQLII